MSVHFGAASQDGHQTAGILVRGELETARPDERASGGASQPASIRTRDELVATRPDELRQVRKGTKRQLAYVASRRGRMPRACV